jgi:hypothetical protein
MCSRKRKQISGLGHRLAALLPSSGKNMQQETSALRMFRSEEIFFPIV